MKVIGYGLFFLAGLYTYIVEIFTFNLWWGMTGFLIGIFLPPVSILFPFIFWFKEGTFPLFYFVVWGLGILGMILATLGSKD